MRKYFYGKGGDDLTKGNLQEAGNIKKAYDEWVGRQRAGKPIRENSILVNIRVAYSAARKLNLTGDPDQDWRAVRQTLEDAACPRLKGIAAEVRNVRIFERGMQLRLALSQDWLDNGAYANALAIVQQAFVQEHFSTSGKPEAVWCGENMHKAKGKQFDEVISFEGWPRVVKGKIVANPDRMVPVEFPLTKNNEQTRRTSCQRYSIKATDDRLTPKNDPCILLL